MINLKIILGSTREGRFSEKLVPWIKENLAKRPEFDPEFLDLRNYPLPFYDQPGVPAEVKGGAYPNEVARKFAAKIAHGDAFLMVAPEYNYSPSAVLKNALDSIYNEWNRKPVGFIYYGSVGGARSAAHLQNIAVALQMMPVRNFANIIPRQLKDEKGNLKEGALAPFDQILQGALDQLLWWANALKAARG